MPIVRYKVTPVVTAGAYSANDVVGARLTFAGLRGGTLQSIIITDDAAQSVAQGDGRGAPAHVLLKGDHQHAEGLAHRAPCHVHEARDGDDYPGVVDAGEYSGEAAALTV